MNKAKKSRKKSKKKAPARKTKSTTLSFWKQKKLLSYIGIVLVITAISLYPSLQNEFVNWDDDKNFYENELVTTSTDLSSLIENTPDIFSTTVIGNYNPLTNFSFAVENVLFGLEKPFFWHLDNLLLHLICTLLVFRIVLALGLSPLAAALCALLFGIHPMRIESVAWITERKDVLFGSFYLLALYYYIKGLKKGNASKYLYIIIPCFLLSGLSKIQAVSLPLSMIVIDYYLKDKLSWNIIWNKWFYFAVSLFIGLLGIYFLGQQGTLESSTDYTPFQRLFIGSLSYMVYIIKLFVPYRLMPVHPYPPDFPTMYYFSMIPALAVVGLFFISIKKNWKVIAFGIGFFTVNVIFLLQIVGAGAGFLADRFTYIGYIGLFFILAFYFQKGINRPRLKKPILIITSLYMLVFSYMSFQQCKIWKNSAVMWTHVIKYSPKTTLPWGNRANYYRDIGKRNLALSDYSRSIALDPNKSQPFNSRGKLYFQSNSIDTLRLAIQDYSRAIEIEPERGEYYMNRGATYARMQNYNQALLDLNKAQELDPENPVIYLNRSIVLHTLGRFQDEVNDVTKYLQLNPRNADMWSNRGTAYVELGQYEQALNDINTAIGLNPNKAIYYFYRARSYAKVGNLEAAQQDLNRASQLGFRYEGNVLNLTQ